MRIAILIAVLAGTVSAGRRDWIGSAACGACHQAEYAAWKTTAHATTAKRFAKQAPEARCLACHGTGEAPAGPVIAVEVGCESCHGAGAAYAEDDVMRDAPVARALGLISTRGATCTACHLRPMRAFDDKAPVHAVGVKR